MSVSHFASSKLFNTTHIFSSFPLSLSLSLSVSHSLTFTFQSVWLALYSSCLRFTCVIRCRSSWHGLGYFLLLSAFLLIAELHRANIAQPQLILWLNKMASLAFCGWQADFFSPFSRYIPALFVGKSQLASGENEPVSLKVPRVTKECEK